MRIVVCGAGYAGVTLARSLERKLEDAEIVVIDERPYHLVQHELHRVIRRPGLAEVISIPLDSLFERAAVQETRIESVDPDARMVHSSDGDIEYDYAAICLGAETAYYGLPGVAEHSIPLKRLDHATRIREAVTPLLDSGGRMVVGGAGLSGVQVAGELAALADESDGELAVTLLERFDTVAPNFPANFREAVAEQLAARDVEICTGTAVERAIDGHIETMGGESIPFDEFVWTGGIRGPEALDGRRRAVRSDLRLDRRTFVVGDAAKVVDDDGEAVPASAQAAIREARTVADNIAALVNESGGGFEPRLDRFGFDSPGWFVSVGNGAVTQLGPSVVTGRAALALKTSVGAGYLSSVGAVGNAVDLVNEELGIAGPVD